MTFSLLGCYEAIAHTSAQMLQAAEQDDWDEVERLEAVCAAQVRAVRDRTDGLELTPQERLHKQRILLSMLRQDAQVRDLADAWMVAWPVLDDHQHRVSRVA